MRPRSRDVPTVPTPFRPVFRPRNAGNAGVFRPFRPRAYARAPLCRTCLPHGADSPSLLWRGRNTRNGRNTPVCLRGGDVPTVPTSGWGRNTGAPSRSTPHRRPSNPDHPARTREALGLRGAPPPAVAAHLAEVRAFVHPGQVVQSTRCPADGCGELAAPTWPAGDLRRCAEAFEPLCARHREVAQVEVLVRDASERAALRVALRSGPLLPWPLPPPVTGLQLAGRAKSQRARKAAPAKHAAKVAARGAKSGESRRGKRTRVGHCSRCSRPGHNARTCGRGGAR